MTDTTNIPTSAAQYNYTAVGGSDIQVMIEFPTILVNGQASVLPLASAISVSYSVYRAKTNVYNMGQPLLSGLAVGKKYVAGSLITVSYQVDEISNFINQYLNSQRQISQAGQAQTLSTTIQNQSAPDASLKSIHTFMKDDLTPFNIYFLMSDEYASLGTNSQGGANGTQIVIYGAQFINNGQVMSINDIITENTLSFIARDVREQTPIGAATRSLTVGTSVLTGSQVLNL